MAVHRRPAGDDRWPASVLSLESACPVVLDDILGGHQRGATTLLTGGSGSGKSACALAFAFDALRRAGRVVLVVTGRADDVRSQARAMGLDIDPPLRNERLLMLRYRADVTRRQSTGGTGGIIAELARVAGTQGLAAIVIDGVAPMLDAPSASADSAEALVAFLEQAGGSALLTYPGELADGYDRRLEPLVQHARAIVRLSVDGDGRHRADLVTMRGPTPRATHVQFAIGTPVSR